VALVPRLTSDSTLTPSAIEEVKGAEALGTPVIQPFRRGQPQRECGGGRQIGSDEAMTRQRSLKRRIRARMARTGERYSTARRQVLRRLGNGVRPVAEQPEAPEARRPRRHRARIGAVGLVLAVAVAAVVVTSSGDGEGPKQPAAEQQVSPVDELPPSLRVQLGELDQVRSVECGAGRRAPVDIRSSLRPSGRATCQIRLGGPAEIIAFKRGGEWQILRAVAAPRTRRLGEA
jgi:hypothetical protein